MLEEVSRFAFQQRGGGWSVPLWILLQESEQSHSSVAVNFMAQNKRPFEKDIRPHVLRLPLGVAITSRLRIELSFS
jgi:hypothetical protein